MIGIAGVAVADNFGIDFSAACLGVLKTFENKDGPAVSHHESPAVQVEGK